MQVSRMSGRRAARWMLTLALLCGLPARGFADLLHYHNGATAQGKVFRITGDIIEFKTRGFGGKEYIKRLTLNNRNDIIETWGNKKYFGELIYIDKFKVELSSPGGMLSLNRFQVKNIVMGTPSAQPLETEFGDPGMQNVSDIAPVAPPQNAVMSAPLPGESVSAPGTGRVEIPAVSE